MFKHFKSEATKPDSGSSLGHDICSTGFLEEGSMPTLPSRSKFINRYRFAIKLGIFIALVIAVSVGVVSVISGVYGVQLLRDESQLRLETVAKLHKQQLTAAIHIMQENLRLLSSRVLIRQLMAKAAVGITLSGNDIEVGRAHMDAAFSSLRISEDEGDLSGTSFTPGGCCGLEFPYHSTLLDSLKR
ncbi:uncharacterized protein EV422DRAFT_350495 [Fimicolochytrium jonesii]|uniref:uncharacterized protein n=1 Tax=Fimicolochytrium jonesii TaxID=1396493 RepID=UPI0022FF1CE1|nr:uncharacterized protein EV422DRAFT_350495 [Fimicolochytrium jonesii]KAI8815642.1 hypothetical protein EV422DRAFT_350495 [Fimicolochytrium jonesii]